MSEFAADSMKPKETAPVMAKDFRCPNCGAPVRLELPGKSQTVRCSKCSSILEPGHDVLQLKKKYKEQFSHKMWIQLGQEGVLDGIKFRCVGMVVREDDAKAEWSEYLLFNPYHGFRYLVESQGHWMLVRSISGFGSDRSGLGGAYGPAGTVNVEEKKLNYFISYTAKVKNVIGEFPWQVQLGEVNEVTEYINPPFIASCEVVRSFVDKNGKKVDARKRFIDKLEKDGSDDDDEDADDFDEDDFQDFLTEKGYQEKITEANWSIGEYKEPAEILAAFKLTELPPKVGFGACEPNPMKRRFWLSMAWTAIMFLATSAVCTIAAGSSGEKIVLANKIELNTADFELKREGSTDYLEFQAEPGSITLEKDENVQVLMETEFSQEWASLNIFFINEATGEGFIYDVDLSYYYGGIGDDSWSEGNRREDFSTPIMPRGTYYIFIAGATNVGMPEFKNNLYRVGIRPAENAAVQPTTAQPANQSEQKKTAGAGAKSPKILTSPLKEAPPSTQTAPKKTPSADTKPSVNPPIPADAKRGKLLPVDFLGKMKSPKFKLNLLLKADVASIWPGFLFILTLLGFNLVYYIRYKSKEGER